MVAVLAPSATILPFRIAAGLRLFEGRGDIASIPPFQGWRSAAGLAKSPVRRGAYLKYLRSGGFWPFFVGMRRPSALTM